MDCSTLASSVHGVLKAKILKWVAIPFSRGSSQPRDLTGVSCTAGRFFTIWGLVANYSITAWEAPPYWAKLQDENVTTKTGHTNDGNIMFPLSYMPHRGYSNYFNIHNCACISWQEQLHRFILQHFSMLFEILQSSFAYLGKKARGYWVLSTAGPLPQVIMWELSPFGGM